MWHIQTKRKSKRAIITEQASCGSCFNKNDDNQHDWPQGVYT